MAAPEPKPLEVRRLVDERAVRIAWDDGHVSRYSWEYLRGWCPCAECQGHTGRRRFIPPGSIELAGIGVVGRYALSFTWNDGHTAGIYTFAYLRQLCECPGCERGVE